MKKILVLIALMIAQTAPAAQYCMAIRGNGELAPAHWGGMASVVEKLGLPIAQAGGSSGSISLFLMEAVASNPAVKDQDLATQKVNASLLLKSLHGVAIVIKNTKDFQQVAQLITEGKNLKNTAWLQEAQKAMAGLDPKTLPQQMKDPQAAAALRQKIAQVVVVLRANFGLAVESGLLNMRSPLLLAVEKLSQPSLTPEATALQLKRVQFYSGELQESIRVFGAFNAQNDVNLFFRPGIADFRGLARQLGRLAFFYTAQGTTSIQGAMWSAFFKSCAVSSLGKTWEELVAVNPSCQTQIAQLVQAHFTGENKDQDLSQTAQVGAVISSLPTTATLIDDKDKNIDTYSQASGALAAYDQALDPQFGKSFVIKNPEGVKFGYWGSNGILRTIKKNLDPQDEKSRRFFPLGPAKWADVLHLSPAEPGLSPIQAFVTSKGEKVISAGGWSDLHPVQVLKAAGCKNVVYITRRGGESLFGQGVAKRLLNLDRDWDVLQTDPKEVKERNAILNTIGDAQATDMRWSALFNMANPQSSFQSALRQADAVLCTDWNAFDIKNGLTKLIDQAYKSPFYVSAEGGLAQEKQLVPVVDTQLVNPLGYPEFGGCYPY